MGQRGKSGCAETANKNGKRMLSFYKAWKRACKEANLSGKLSHDFSQSLIFLHVGR